MWRYRYLCFLIIVVIPFNDWIHSSLLLCWVSAHLNYSDNQNQGKVLRGSYWLVPVPESATRHLQMFRTMFLRLHGNAVAVCGYRRIPKLCHDGNLWHKLMSQEVHLPSGPYLYRFLLHGSSAELKLSSTSQAHTILGLCELRRTVLPNNLWTRNGAAFETLLGYRTRGAEYGISSL